MLRQTLSTEYNKTDLTARVENLDPQTSITSVATETPHLSQLSTSKNNISLIRFRGAALNRTFTSLNIKEQENKTIILLRYMIPVNSLSKDRLAATAQTKKHMENLMKLRMLRKKESRKTTLYLKVRHNNTLPISILPSNVSLPNQANGQGQSHFRFYKPTSQLDYPTL